MKSNEYGGQLINKRDGVYTEFRIGKNVREGKRNKIIKAIISLGGNQTKEGKYIDKYLLKGEWIDLSLIF